MKKEHSLYDELSKLRLLAAVLYDQGTFANLSEEEKYESIQPVQHRRDELIKEAIAEQKLDQVIIAIKDIEEDAASDARKARRHTEKSQEALSHAQRIKDILKAYMLSHAQVELIHGNYMATIVDAKLEVR